MLVNLYGTPAKLDEIKAICDEHGAIHLLGLALIRMRFTPSSSE